jgi:hypothetical protein
MKGQKTLDFAKPPANTNPGKALGYDEANLRSAREILADVERHGGTDAFPAIWARSVLQRLEAETKQRAMKARET